MAVFAVSVRVEESQEKPEIDSCHSVSSPPHRTAIIVLSTLAMIVHTRGAETISEKTL